MLTSTKPQAWKLQLNKMGMVAMVLWKETALGVRKGMLLSWWRLWCVCWFLVSTQHISHVVPCSAVFTARRCGRDMAYLSILFCDVVRAAAPGLVAVLPMWDSAYVKLSHPGALGFPLDHGRTVVPSGRLLLSHSRLASTLSWHLDRCP